VCDPTIRQPGFDLPRQQWSLLNRFRTEQGHCGVCRRKWRLTDTDLCPCGETQTMSHVVECDKTEWQLISATLCGWRRCFVADQLWLMRRIREEDRSRHVILHQSAKFCPNWTAHCSKMTSCRFSRWRISASLDFRGLVMGSLKSPCTTSYRTSDVSRHHSFNA